MPNMSYCRFRNTLNDFKDCLYALDDVDEFKDETSEEEKYAAKKLRELCEEYIEQYDYINGE